jgi:hypothetical protein
MIAVAVAAAATTAACGRSFIFAGERWCALRGLQDDPQDPVTFSDKPNSVYVDARGRLHLRIAHRNGKWYCAEIYREKPSGYGTYRFSIEGALGALDPNVIVGLFTWSDDPAYADREIDIEFARWGAHTGPNADIAIQPYARPYQYARFTVPPQIEPLTAELTWLQGRATFRVSAPMGLRFHDALTHGVPPAGGDTHLHINIWLRANFPPQSGLQQEIIIDRFSYEPRAR